MKKVAIYVILSIIPAYIFSQSLLSVNPDSANAGQTLNVTITGSNTHFLQGSASTVDFGFSQGTSSAVNYFYVQSNTSITANVSIPTYTYTGDYGVFVYNSIDGPLSLGSVFYVNGINLPALVSVNPNTAQAGQTLNVTINGEYTHFIQGSVTTVDFDFNQASPTTVVNNYYALNDTQIYTNITVPPSTNTGSYDVYVSNSIDGPLGLFNGFYVGTIGIELRTKTTSMAVYPNPVSEDITIESNGLDNKGSSMISVYTMEGKLVLKRELSNEIKGSTVILMGKD